MHTCYCIGNPLVDYITEVPEEIITELKLDKGRFHLCGKERAEEVLERVKDYRFRIVPGGASANTACGVARMGGEPFFNGGIGDDDFGAIFQNALDEAGVYSSLVKYGDPTGSVVVLVTPDAERTFVVCLGSSQLLEPAALDLPMMRKCNFLYFTGYQFEHPGLRAVVTAAVTCCRSLVTRVVMDLADPGIVTRNRDALQAFIREHVDVLLANEEEGRMYTGLEGRACVDAMAADAEYAILKQGANGSFIRYRNTCQEVSAVKVEAVDTTGAGDMYAAGIIMGLDRGYSLEYTGRMASYAASLVVSRKGARLDRSIAREIEHL